MGYPRAATPELIQEIERVCRMRLAAKTIPSDHHLARKHNVSERVVARWMLMVRKAIQSGGQPDKEADTATPFHVEQGSGGQ